jgi:hypothetical protein
MLLLVFLLLLPASPAVTDFPAVVRFLTFANVSVVAGVPTVPVSPLLLVSL